MRNVASPMRPVACALLVALALSAVPARGADDVAAPSRPASLNATAAAVVARMEAAPAPALQQGSAPAASGSGEGFLSGNRGKIAAVLFVAGLVVTIVSRQKDAVHSPAR
jgi:hypothetical protein